MTHTKRTRIAAILPVSALAAGFLALGLPGRAASFTATPFATGAAVNATSPDSITIAGGNVFVEYGNGAASDGSDGLSSTIAQYSLDGTLKNSFTVTGLADGLRYDPYTDQLWALLNNDGNAKLTIYDLSTGVATNPATYTYAVTSPDRGYDDVQFLNGKAYLSYTNPGADPNDTTNAVIVTPTFSGTTITTNPVLLATQAGNITDPDSLDLTTNGSLLLTGEADGTLTTVTGPGPGQTVRTAALVDASNNPLNDGDDVLFAPSSAAGLLVADPHDNTIYKVQGDFTPGDYYGSVGTTGTVDQIDLTTGLSTPITTGLLPNGANPHGLAFLPAATPAVPEASPLGLFGLGLVGLPLCSRRRRTPN